MNTNDSVNSQEVETDLDEYEVPSNRVVVELGDNDSDNTYPVKVSEMNSYFLMREKIYTDTLSPQLVLNEEEKRKHKNTVVEKLFSILKWQFIAMYAFSFIIIIAIIFGGCFNSNVEMIKYVFDFLKFYITSILAELIAILFFIVKQVFDKSIVELFKNFDKKF